MSGSLPLRVGVVRVLIPALVLIALVGPMLALSSRLPASVTIHWNVSGHPTNHAPWSLLLASLVVVWGLAWAALLRETDSAHHGPTRIVVANIYGLFGLLVGAEGMTLWASIDTPSWQASRTPVGGVILLLAGAVLGAGIGWLLAGTLPVGSPDALLRAGLSASEQAVWTGSAHNWWAIVAAGALAAFAVIGSSRGPLGEAALLLLAVVLVGLSHVLVVVGPAGVTTAIGLWHWPSRHIPLTHIQSAEAVTIAALAYGGWGWRRRPGYSALIIRSGDTLELLLTTESRYLVTVDDAASAVGLVNDYAARLGRHTLSTSH